MWMRKEVLLNFICRYTRQFNVFPSEVWSGWDPQSQFNLLWNQRKTTAVICHNSCLQKNLFLQNTKKSLKALAHHSWNYKKISDHPYTLQLFLTTLVLFPTVCIWTTIITMILKKNCGENFWSVSGPLYLCAFDPTSCLPVLYFGFKTKIVYTCFLLLGCPHMIRGRITTKNQ